MSRCILVFYLYMPSVNIHKFILYDFGPMNMLSKLIRQAFDINLWLSSIILFSIIYDLVPRRDVLHQYKHMLQFSSIFNKHLLVLAWLNEAYITIQLPEKFSRVNTNFFMNISCWAYSIGELASSLHHTVQKS